VGGREQRAGAGEADEALVGVEGRMQSRGRRWTGDGDDGDGGGRAMGGVMDVVDWVCEAV
jgi:hypothetical protein